MIVVHYLTYFALHLYCKYGNCIMHVEIPLLLYRIPTQESWESHEALWESHCCCMGFPIAVNMIFGPLVKTSGALYS
jgi:hypothetical protein